MVPIMLRGCVAKEFAGFATNADRPVAHYLRALARDLNEKTPGKGVGVIGQCFTGGFALAAAVDDSVLAPVLSQPSVPIGLTPKRKRDPGLSEGELKVVEQRAANEGLCALGLRFSEDPLAPGERFKTLKDRLGDAFEVIEINSKKGNEHGFGKMAHSVLTLEVREHGRAPGLRGAQARRRVPHGAAGLSRRLRLACSCRVRRREPAEKLAPLWLFVVLAVLAIGTPLYTAR